MSTKLALMSEIVAAQFAQNREQSAGLELLQASTWSAFMERCREAQVAVVELERMGEEPLRGYADMQACGVKLVIITHLFAKKSTLQALTNAGARLMKSPLQLAQLRSQMMSIIVKDLLSGGSHV